MIFYKFARQKGDTIVWQALNCYTHVGYKIRHQQLNTQNDEQTKKIFIARKRLAQAVV